MEEEEYTRSEIMKDLDVNHIENIENLQQKIELYKETLNALKNHDATDELNRLNMKINDTKQSMKAMNHQQEIELKKYAYEVSMLTEQLDTLNQTVHELIEKVSTIIEEKNQIQPKTKRPTTQTPATPASNIPSFQQLQQLLADTPLIESPLPETNVEKERPIRREIQNNRFPISSQINNSKAKSRQSMHNFNKPSAQKKFSVTLDSTNVSPLQTEIKSHPIPEEPPIVESFIEEEELFKEEPVQEPIQEPVPTQPKEASSFLNFFRKK